MKWKNISWIQIESHIFISHAKYSHYTKYQILKLYFTSHVCIEFIPILLTLGYQEMVSCVSQDRTYFHENLFNCFGKEGMRYIYMYVHGTSRYGDS